MKKNSIQFLSCFLLLSFCNSAPGMFYCCCKGALNAEDRRSRKPNQINQQQHQKDSTEICLTAANLSKLDQQDARYHKMTKALLNQSELKDSSCKASLKSFSFYDSGEDNDADIKLSIADSNDYIDEKNS